ncbi:GyrI-like domain-containing protein [Paenibacillus hunanensis]|uniref:GyrI-like domain-containing protein n=1 Tax=Paenibacillus hunanensis TaxID=539262 RepID=UPI002A6A7769|nr:GyrI-like domain-containing protein [Paenibacillus hunanensis]WPP39963.1 GyrI-like domain-containing protein [Paenibacillus hunanensis]
MKLYTIHSIRTNNFKDTEMLEKIQEVWQQAYSHLDGRPVTLYGVYHDYENDYKGDYSLTTAIAESYDGATALELPVTAQYRVFEAATSDPQGVIQQWKQIWQLEEQGELSRAYTFDYEQYEPDGRITIHIALAPELSSETNTDSQQPASI